MQTVGPVVAGIMKATLTENGFSADQMGEWKSYGVRKAPASRVGLTHTCGTGVMAFLGALRPHMTDPTLAASASALALKFIPAPMVAMFLPGATAPPAASAGAPPAAPAPAP